MSTRRGSALTPERGCVLSSPVEHPRYLCGAVAVTEGFVIYDVSQDSRPTISDLTEELAIVSLRGATTFSIKHSVVINRQDAVERRPEDAVQAMKPKVVFPLPCSLLHWLGIASWRYSIVLLVNVGTERGCRAPAGEKASLR